MCVRTDNDIFNMLLQGDLLCCETCPTTVHAACMDLTVSADQDWYCPGCVCYVCDKPMFESLEERHPVPYHGKCVPMESEEHYQCGMPGIHLCDESNNENGSNLRFYGKMGSNDRQTVPFDDVHSACGGHRAHPGCLPHWSEILQNDSPWYQSESSRLCLQNLARLCCKGVEKIGTYKGGANVMMQMIRCAAVSGEPWSGYGPFYSTEKKQHLRGVLSAALIILRSCYDRLFDSRTGYDLLPYILQGKRFKAYEDFSDMHVAVLLVSGIVVSVACVRLLGNNMAEIPLLATRPEVQHCGAGSALLSAIEDRLRSCGVTHVIMPATYSAGFPYLPSRHPPELDLPPSSMERFGYTIANKEVVRRAVQGKALRFPGVPWVVKDVVQSKEEGIPMSIQNLALKTLRWNATADPGPLVAKGMLRITEESTENGTTKSANTTISREATAELKSVNQSESTMARDDEELDIIGNSHGVDVVNSTNNLLELRSNAVSPQTIPRMTNILPIVSSARVMQSVTVNTQPVMANASPVMVSAQPLQFQPAIMVPIFSGVPIPIVPGDINPRIVTTPLMSTVHDMKNVGESRKSDSGKDVAPSNNLRSNTHPPL